MEGADPQHTRSVFVERVYIDIVIGERSLLLRIVFKDRKPVAVVAVEPIYRPDPHEALTILEDTRHGVDGQAERHVETLKSDALRSLCPQRGRPGEHHRAQEKRKAPHRQTGRSARPRSDTGMRHKADNLDTQGLAKTSRVGLSKTTPPIENIGMRCLRNTHCRHRMPIRLPFPHSVRSSGFMSASASGLSSQPILSGTLYRRSPPSRRQK